MGKRKQDEFENSLSRKKTASFSDIPEDDDSSTGIPETFKLNVQKEVALPPLLATTPGIEMPFNVSFDMYKRPVQGRDQPLRRGQLPPPSRSSDVLLQSSRHPRLDYLVTEEDGECVQGKLNHYIAVYDPSTGSLKVVPTHKLVARTFARPAEETPMEDVSGDKLAATLRAQRDALGNQFGTNKTKKAISARSANVITSNNATDADLASGQIIDAVSSTGANSLDRTGMQEQVDSAKPRPRANLNATTVAEVYRPESLMGSDNARTINVDGWVSSIREGQDVVTASRFVAKRIGRLVTELDEATGLDGSDPEANLKLLRYQLFLIELFGKIKNQRGSDKRARKWPKKEEFETMHPGSANLARKARKLFSENNEVTRWHIDYLATHIAAISLVIDKFETDTFDLRQDLNLDNREMTQYYREIGARVTEPGEKSFATKKEASTHRIAKLKLPLDWPRQRMLPSKKR